MSHGHEAHRPVTVYLVAAAVLRRADEVALVCQRGRDDPRAYWMLPSGVVKPGEMVADALVREVREEVGLEVTDPGRLAFVTQSPRAITLAFEVASWRGEIHPADPDGLVTAARFLPLAEAIAKLERAPIRAMWEPAAAYLRCEAGAGTVWAYPDDAE